MSANVTRKGNIIVLGDDQIRIEEGPKLRTAVANEELLHDDNTADHYYAGVKDMHFLDALGKPYTQPRLGRDAVGNVIKLGEEFTYLDRGGKAASGSKCFYIYQRREIDPNSMTLENGDANPHYVAPEVQKGSLLDRNDGTPDNRPHYTYMFDEVATRATEEAAIEYGQRLLEKAKG
jgi:hypothetical protein